MAFDLALPKSTVALIRKNPLTSRHPGLQLDKLSVPGDQEEQRKALEQVIQTSGDVALLNDLRQRRRTMLSSLPGMRWWRCQTTGPFTLHLARAAALENAGICLHPLYGFVYLPGSGLKGLARAYAETLWLPAQANSSSAWRTIEDIFGWAPNRDRQQYITAPNHPAKRRYDCDADPTSAEIPSHTGAVIFHDAWPETWPHLEIDIVNSHHGEYYGAQPQDTQHPPGDWENPVPVYFLAVAVGTAFTFAVSKRRSDVDDHLVNLARQWLIGALSSLGAGAKTAAGYGSFTPLAETAEVKLLMEAPRQARESTSAASPVIEFSTTLTLITPAFLAGAQQLRQDCDLRPATLRGLLRWWWRTLHAAHVDVGTLWGLEAAVWGNTNIGGAVRITVEPLRPVMPELYNYKDRSSPKREFQAAHELENRPNNRTTQGLFYASYGMDEISGGAPKQRWYAPPGTQWTVRLTARPSVYEERNNQNKVMWSQDLPAASLLDQAKAALWLLCHFGGVGAKARKGFGSLADPADLHDLTVDACKTFAKQFRDFCGIASYDSGRAVTPALESMLTLEDIQTSWKDCWFALDQLGFSMQAFAQQHKHHAEKQALGLPRKIHGPLPRPLPGQISWRPPENLNGPQGDRHASPAHYHVAQGTNGSLIIRVTAFPAAYLPNMNASRTFLQQLLTHLTTDMARRARIHINQAQRAVPVLTASAGSPSSQVSGTTKRPSGTSVLVTIVAVRPRGGYEVQEEGKSKGTLTVGTQPSPPPQEGDQVHVLIHNDDPRNPQYRWGTLTTGQGRADRPAARGPQSRSGPYRRR